MDKSSGRVFGIVVMTGFVPTEDICLTINPDDT